MSKRSNTVFNNLREKKKLDQLSKMNNSDVSIIERSIERFKVILIGDTDVGKTSVLNRFLHNKFRMNYSSTIGVDYCVKSLVIDNKSTVDLQIWDTCGQERYRTLTRQYYHNTHGCLLVFDLTKKETFTNISMWIDDLIQYGSKDMVILLIGNKSDLKEIRKIDESEIKELTSKYKLQYIETSAKTGDCVKSSFESLSKLLIIKNEELILKNKNEKKNTSANISIELKKDHSGKKKKNSKACCV